MRSFKNPYPYWYLEVLLALSDKYFLIAEDKTILGYIIGIPLQNHVCHIASIAVDPTVRRRKIGSMLIQSLLYVCNSEGYDVFTLEVEYRNYAAQLFYVKNGFSPFFLLPDHYGLGKHAMVMVNVLTSDIWCC